MTSSGSRTSVLGQRGSETEHEREEAALKCLYFLFNHCQMPEVSQSAVPSSFLFVSQILCQEGNVGVIRVIWGQPLPGLVFSFPPKPLFSCFLFSLDHITPKCVFYSFFASLNSAKPLASFSVQLPVSLTSACLCTCLPSVQPVCSPRQCRTSSRAGGFNQTT